MREPCGPAMTILASSSSASMHHSKDGSACAMLPPNVPAFGRVVADETGRARQDRVALEDAGLRVVSMSRCVARAPIRSASPSRLT